MRQVVSGVLHWRGDQFLLKVKGAKAGDKIGITWIDNKGEKSTVETTIAGS